MHERHEFEGNDGRKAGISWLRLREEWAAWIRDPHGIYETVDVCGSFEEACDALRSEGTWHGLPAAGGRAEGSRDSA